VGTSGYTQGLHYKILVCKKALFYGDFSRSLYSGGEGGIRTPDRLAPMPHFECGAIDHSATSPGAMAGGLPPRSGGVLGEDGGADKARTRQICPAPRETPCSPGGDIEDGPGKACGASCRQAARR
jgi:hypothetical protein